VFIVLMDRQKPLNFCFTLSFSIA